VSTLEISLAKSNADNNSNLGIVILLAGLTLVLATTNSTDFPALVSTWIYTTAVNAWD